MYLAHAWSVLVDRWMRRAALIHELEKLGYKTNDDMLGLLKDKDPKNRIQAVERSNKAMVQFDNLGDFEKNTLRHIIFVYPWVSRSAVWAIRTMIEHPLKTWGLSELGRIGEEKAAEFFSNGEVDEFSKWLAPDWFKRTGYVPIARTGDGSPVVLNFNSVNSFSTMSELYTQAKATGVAMTSPASSTWLAPVCSSSSMPPQGATSTESATQDGPPSRVCPRCPR
jgi:hypothetical protein